MTKTATFGAGCFWGVEAAFRQLQGVTATEAGYMGGSLENPSYKDVCTDRTGHAEVVQVRYDPERVSYETCSTSSGRSTTRRRSTVRGPMSEPSTGR